MENFYKKLKESKHVNILIVGDSIGENCGASRVDTAWTKMLCEHIRKEYGCDYTLTNVSMGGNASYAGYSRTMALDDNVDYDLVIICYGQNDSIKDFDLYYELIIRAVYRKYKNASIISILESAQRTYTEKMNIIRKIADYYSIPIADTIAPFNAGDDEEYMSYTIDGCHPNDKGQIEYEKAVYKALESVLLFDMETDFRNKSAICDRCYDFDNFVFLKSDTAQRNDNTFVFSLKEEISGIVGIDFDYVYKRNYYKLVFDNNREEILDFDFNFNMTQHHIMPVSDDVIHADSTVTVIIENKYQADSFRGLYISFR